MAENKVNLSKTEYRVNVVNMDYPGIWTLST